MFRELEPVADLGRFLEVGLFYLVQPLVPVLVDGRDGRRIGRLDVRLMVFLYDPQRVKAIQVERCRQLSRQLGRPFLRTGRKDEDPDTR